jgi:CubicO group peptidase (beta-lactamase class C family)
LQALLKPALAYVDDWLQYQMRWRGQPGCAVAVACRGRVVFEQAYGFANLAEREKLTPRHRFHAASHSKSFTAAGILKLREAGKLRLDDPVGRYVAALPPAVAQVTLSQILSHSAGLARDGVDAGYFQGRKPFPNETELRADLANSSVIDASTRFKYSNSGFGLLGLVIQSAAGEPYGDWIRREIIAASELEETEPKGPVSEGIPVAQGHSAVWPLGERVVIPGNIATGALAPAAGVLSTAADLARFFGSLDPRAKSSVLSSASRREMVRMQWRIPNYGVEMHSGFGLLSAKVGNGECIGHIGGLQGCVSSTGFLPGHDLCVSVLTNAVDGFAVPWTSGVVHILHEFARRGVPANPQPDWSGRWWSVWGAIDLIPMRDHVVVTKPDFFNPFTDTREIAVASSDLGRIRHANGFDEFGETARLVRGSDGRVEEVWLGGIRHVPERQAKDEIKRQYGNRQATNTGPRNAMNS